MESMSTKTVVDKSIKSACGVKYPTKKDRARRYFDPSGLMRYMGIMAVRNPGCPKPLGVRNPWVSETRNPLGVRNPWVSETPGCPKPETPWGSWVSETTCLPRN